MSEELLLPPLSADAAELLEAERLCPGPSAAMRAYILERVAATVAAGGGGGAIGGGGGEGGGYGAAPASATGVGGAGLLIKPGLIVAFVVGVGAGVGGTLAVQSAQPTHVAPSSLDRRQAALTIAPPSAPATPSASFVASTPPPPARPASTPSTRPNGNGAHKRIRAATAAPAPAATAESLAAERRLVEMARAALARTRPKDALAALAQHRQRFPQGLLAEERDALSVLARIANADGTEARDEAQRFRDRYPRSLLLPAIEAALDAEKRRNE